MAEKKYVSLSKLSKFLDNLFDYFSLKDHKHTVSEIGADPAGSANTALASAKTYTDQAVAQKAQVQIVTWGAND